MAKGNLFLGTAARSVGDVVMYRREGSQVSRVRVRKIANPKTDAQCKQRAYMAPIPKFFSPLAIVLERSFEGLSKSKSYSKFLKVNADKARANDWLLPKGTAFFPLPYQLSQGSLPSIKYQVEGPRPGLNIPGLTLEEAPTTIGDLSEAFVSLGYQNGDVITFIGAIMNGDSISSGFIPVYSQFEIDTTSTDTIATAMPNFSFTWQANVLAVQYNGNDLSGGAIIAARFENEKWRRSTQSMVVVTTVTTAIAAADYKAAAIASYSNTVSEPNPMVYLDGEELS